MAKGMRAREERHVSEEYGRGEDQGGGDVVRDIGANNGTEDISGSAAGTSNGGEAAGAVGGKAVTGLENSSSPEASADPRYIRTDTAVDSTKGGATKGRTEAEKLAAFSRLASIRASNAFDALRGLSHLANTKQYSFTREQVDKMLNQLSDSIEALRKAFDVALEPAAPKAEGETKSGRRRKERVSFSVRV